MNYWMKQKEKVKSVKVFADKQKKQLLTVEQTITTKILSEDEMLYLAGDVYPDLQNEYQQIDALAVQIFNIAQNAIHRSQNEYIIAAENYRNAVMIRRENARIMGQVS